MKVLMTSDNIGGVWTFALTLARMLKSNGTEVYLAVTGNELSDNQISQLNQIGFNHWYFNNSRLEWMPEPWEDILRTGEWLMSIKQDVQPDIVHLNSFSYGSLPWGVPVVITAHSCICSWWQAVRHEQAPSDWRNYKRHVERGIQSADVITAPSKSMLDAIGKYYEPVKQKMVIYNGGDSSAYFSGDKEDIVFSMGRLWDEAKNVNLILDAATYIRYPVYIAGNADISDTMRIPGNVHFIGHKSPDEISNWLSRASVYLLPVLYEPFGYTFLEAAFSGCAIVTGDIESMREIWADTVIFADTANSSRLAHTVNTLMKRKGLRQQLAERSRDRALTRYTSQRMADEYHKLYKSLSGINVRMNYELHEK